MYKTPDQEEIRKINSAVSLWLRKQGISREEAARRLDVKPDTVSVMLSCRPFSPERARRWSQEFGLSERFLLTGEGPVTERRTGYRKVVEENDALRTECKRFEADNRSLREELERYRELYGPLPVANVESAFAMQ